MGTLQEFFYPSSDGKSRIHAALWLPEGKPVAVVQIAHGVAEYILRYDAFARFLTEQGFAVVGNDHLGHGLSRAEQAETLYFTQEEGWRCATDDLYALRRHMQGDFEGLPYFMLGHSMGSFLLRSYLIRYPCTLSGAIVMGTGQMPTLALWGGRLVARLEAARRGWNAFSPLTDKLSFGGYNAACRPARTDWDWLSLNEENVDAYMADPLCGEPISLELFYEMLGGMQMMQKEANLRCMDRRTPVLFIAGGKDPVGQMGKGVTAACESFRRIGVLDTELKLYPTLRHEILNEKEKQQVYEDILLWIKKRL